MSSQHERNLSFGHNWRQNVFGEAMLSGIEAPPSIAHRFGDTTPLDTSSDGEKPISPFHLLSPFASTNSPITPIDGMDVPPKVPPKGSQDVIRPNPDINQSISRQRSNKILKAEVPPRASTALGTMRPKAIVIPRKKTSSAILAEQMANKTSTVEKPQKPLTRQRADTAPSETSGFPPTTTRPKLHLDTNPQILSPTSTQKEGEPVHRKPRRRKSSTTDATLPRGIRPSEASTQFSSTDIEMLQQAAKLQTENYAVLRPGDVRFLQKELAQLDSRCQYLKETQKSLRAGRKTLQTRMLSYLRSSRSGIFSRESLLKQEEALAELDDAIEDWDRKVEKVSIYPGKIIQDF